MLQIQFIPCITGTIGISPYQKKEDGQSMVFRYRKGEPPVLFMHQVSISHTDGSNSNSFRGLMLCGNFVGEESFDTLQDGDTLFYTLESDYACDHKPFYLDMYPSKSMLTPFEVQGSVLELAAGMEAHPSVYMCTPESEGLLARATQIAERTKHLYASHPAYHHIMLKSPEGIVTESLVSLAAKQDPKKTDAFIALFMALSTNRNGNVAIANRILENCTFSDAFSLLTQEEQVSAFIEFSKVASTKKMEYVSDQLLSLISQSREYQRVKDDLTRQGLGLSKTQQFNVLQQVGYFSRKTEAQDSILYNLSDMGAGKTLMTVEAIFLLDLKQIRNWEQQRTEIREDLIIDKVYLPDKHIIAPTLSVKSSWINTFRLFYDVTEVDDHTYTLSVTYDGITAFSTIYVAPFTVKNGNIFVQNKLPETAQNTYLIIDEIHQLVAKSIAKTKFFQPNTNPSQVYRIFILSGTMSNLKSQQWFHFMRFMGLSISKRTANASATYAENLSDTYRTNIRQAATTIRSEQHRYFDSEPFTAKNCYYHKVAKKQTSVEQEFFTQYSSQILQFDSYAEESVESILNSASRFSLVADPTELDSINFELFYKIVGCKAVTAQSLQVAEELFGEQKKQHVSDIIKTVSPLSKSDIQILKTLHHIAEDHHQYKSVTIAKAINNAILNLNDGLQTKNIYDIVSGFADKNMRFFEYLASLDVNILEQLPESGLIAMPKLEDTDKFKVLKDILQREKEETHLIVVNDYYALKALSEALGIEHLTKDQLKQELDYQEVLDDLFEKQSIVIVTQDMIKSSLDLVQANRLIQYQLNTEISDIIQTQNRINRIGQTRETRGYYIASDQLQENLITLFLESYRNIRVAHKGIVELFTDITSQINVVNDYLERAFAVIEQEDAGDTDITMESESETETVTICSDLATSNPLPEGAQVAAENNSSRAILYPQQDSVLVLLPLTNGNAFPIGTLTEEKKQLLRITMPTQVRWNLTTNTVEE